MWSDNVRSIAVETDSLDIKLDISTQSNFATIGHNSTSSILPTSFKPSAIHKSPHIRSIHPSSQYSLNLSL